MKVSKALVNGRNICMVGTLAPSDSSWFRVASKVMTNYCTLIQRVCSKKHEWKSMWVYSDFVCSTGSSSSSESLAPSYSPLVASWTVLELLRINQTNCRYPTILFFRIFTKMEYQYQWRPYRITRQRKTAHSSYSFFTIANIPSPGYISARFLTPLLIMYFVLGRKGTGLITRVHKVLEDPNRRLGSREHFMYPRNKPAFLPIRNVFYRT